jgi:hypothetical protein
VTGTATATGSAINARINVYSPANAQTWTGNDRDGLYLWGAQVEAGAFPTSYIPTVASQVTRSADAASMTGTNFSSWYRADEGTLYAEAISNGFVINQMIASITNGTLTNPVQVYQDAVSQLQTNAWGNGTVTNTITVGTNFKFAYGLALNNLASSVNGGAVSTDLSVGPASTTYSQMNIGNRNGLLFWNGTIKKLAYYPQRLTNAQLQALTTV